MVAATEKKKSSLFRTSLGELNPNNIGQLRKLNAVLFPVHYSDKFYKNALESGEFAKLIYFNDVCVGAVCCRKDPSTEHPEIAKLYIMTLGVLSPYRHLGLGSQLLYHIIDHITATQPANPTPNNPRIAEIYLHVQITNDEALYFYKKHSFEVVEEVKGYYKNIEPADAFLLQRKIE